ncbi:MAG TPA: hypothetical protein PKJ24_06885 [Prolixibacteraceae bacterium]|nr:hypothetical protein [Prolixibacteraceae bacterium]
MKNLARYFPLLLIFVLVSCGKEKDPESIDELFFDPAGTGEKAYSVYSNVEAAQKSVLVKEDFNDNAMKWFTGQKSTTGEKYDFQIVQGKYIIDYNKAGYYTTTFNDFDVTAFSEDFEIETSIWIQSIYQSNAEVKNFAGLVWNRNESSSRYFMSTYDKKVLIGASESSQTTPWKNWENSPLLLGTYNKLTLRKVGGYFYFFINEKFLYKRDVESVSYPGVGFRVSDCKVYIDYLYFSRLRL